MYTHSHWYQALVYAVHDKNPNIAKHSQTVFCEKSLRGCCSCESFNGGSCGCQDLLSFQRSDLMDWFEETIVGDQRGIQHQTSKAAMQEKHVLNSSVAFESIFLICFSSTSNVACVMLLHISFPWLWKTRQPKLLRVSKFWLITMMMDLKVGNQILLTDFDANPPTKSTSTFKPQNWSQALKVTQFPRIKEWIVFS